MITKRRLLPTTVRYLCNEPLENLDPNTTPPGVILGKYGIAENYGGEIHTYVRRFSNSIEDEIAFLIPHLQTRIVHRDLINTNIPDWQIVTYDDLVEAGILCAFAIDRTIKIKYNSNGLGDYIAVVAGKHKVIYYTSRSGAHS